MDLAPLFRQLTISLLLGLLVGLQRERTESDIAGFRTFPLITAFGTLCAALATEFGFPWFLGIGFGGVIAVAVVGNIPKLRQADPDWGVTTEMAMLVMYAVGALVVVGPWVVAVAVGGGVAILLHLKPELHGFAARMGDQDFKAILQFVLITFIILPVLPDRKYDPLAAIAPVIRPFFPDVQFREFAVLNPYEIWWLVVLVVGISLGAYVSYKLFGGRAGTVLGGVLGGTISSTATTVSYSRKAVQSPDAATGYRAPTGGWSGAAAVIMIASTVTYVRVLLEIAVAGPRFLPAAFGPIAVLFGVSLLLSIVVWLSGKRELEEMPVQGNPTELKSAIVFAALYAVVLMAVAAGRAFFSDEALYGIAVLSGMTDMDAITLSTARLVQSGPLDAETGWRLVVTATMSNLVFKAGLVAVVAGRQLFKQIALLFGLSLLAGAAVLIFW